jgi:hypothetical protein
MATLNRRDRTRITADTDAAASGTKDSMSAANGNPVPLSTLRRSLHSNVHNNNAPGAPPPKLYPIVSITREVQVDSDDTHSQKESDEKVGPVGVSAFPLLCSVWTRN